MERIANTIRADHRDLALCYCRLVDADDEDEQTRLQNQFTWELARHLVGEELVLFPAMEKNLRHEQEDDRDNHHHQEVRCSFASSVCVCVCVCGSAFFCF